MSKYYNSNLDRTSNGGGSQRVTLAGGVAQGTTTECRFCRIQVDSANTAEVRVRIDTACTGTTGVALPGNPTITPYSIGDLDQLYFYSTDATAIVDIEYFT